MIFSCMGGWHAQLLWFHFFLLDVSVRVLSLDISHPNRILNSFPKLYLDFFINVLYITILQSLGFPCGSFESSFYILSLLSSFVIQQKVFGHFLCSCFVLVVRGLIREGSSPQMMMMQCNGYDNLVIVEYLGHPGIREYLSFVYLFNSYFVYCQHLSGPYY